MTTQDHHEIEQLIAKVEAVQERLASVWGCENRRAAKCHICDGQLFAVSEALQALRQSLLSALLAEVPPVDDGAERRAFEAGWRAAERNEHAADDEDVADAPDVAWSDYQRVAEVPPPPERPMCAHCGKRPAMTLCQECLK